MSDIEYEEINQQTGVVGEVTPEDADLPNPVRDMIRSITKDDFSTANGQFDAEVGSRLQDVLDAARAKIAGQVFNRADNLPDTGYNDEEEVEETEEVEDAEDSEDNPEDES
jgi:hypothetical protein